MTFPCVVPARVVDGHRQSQRRARFGPRGDDAARSWGALRAQWCRSRARLAIGNRGEIALSVERHAGGSPRREAQLKQAEERLQRAAALEAELAADRGKAEEAAASAKKREQEIGGGRAVGQGQLTRWRHRASDVEVGIRIIVFIIIITIIIFIITRLLHVVRVRGPLFLSIVGLARLRCQQPLKVPRLCGNRCGATAGQVCPKAASVLAAPPFRGPRQLALFDSAGAREQEHALLLTLSPSKQIVFV